MIRSETLVLLVLCPWSIRPENVLRLVTHTEEKETEREKEGGWQWQDLRPLSSWSSAPGPVCPHM